MRGGQQKEPEMTPCNGPSVLLLYTLVFSDLKNCALLATWSLVKITPALVFSNAAWSWLIYSFSKLFNSFSFYLPQDHGDIPLDYFSSLSSCIILSIVSSFIPSFLTSFNKHTRPCARLWRYEDGPVIVPSFWA